MRERPILFSTEMVKAIKSGIKEMTRREIKQEWLRCLTVEDDYDKIIELCPYGKIGDLLWVRETFVPWKMSQGDNIIQSGFYYRANFLNGSYPTIHKWKPSIFMPKAAARIWLEITSIKIERLNEISPIDAAVEGIHSTWIHEDLLQCKFKNYINDGRGSLGPVESFQSLWKSINGEESLNANPWVWVIYFKVLSTTGKP